jgi:hypothetical protein
MVNRLGGVPGRPARAVAAQTRHGADAQSASGADAASVEGLHFQLAKSFLPEPGQRAGFALLGAFLLSFLFIRTSTRLIRNPKVTWWPGGAPSRP